MNIFDVHEEIINDYSSYIESFVNIKNDFIRGNVEGEYLLESYGHNLLFNLIRFLNQVPLLKN